MNDLKELYQDLLKPFQYSRKGGELKEYFKREFVRNRLDTTKPDCITLLLEFDNGAPFRYWAGIYFGIRSEKNSSCLSHSEIQNIKDDYKSWWMQRHNMNVVDDINKLFLPDDKSSDSEMWYFWIRVREEEGVPEALNGMNVIARSLVKLGFIQK